MAGWVAGHPGPRRVLDPAVGRGALVRALLEVRPRWEVCARDLDPRMLASASADLGSASVEWRRADYIYSDWDERFDAVVCNPPYLHFRRYAARRRALDLCRERLGVRLSGLSNLYALFLLKSVYQLAPGGRAAYIVPAEFLNADYGVAVKRYLLDAGVLRAAVVFDHRRRVFAEALTTACVLLMERGGGAERVAFAHVDAADELAGLAPALYGGAPADARVRYRAASGLDPGLKWSRYYRDEGARPRRNLAPLRRFGRVVRGIATGANAFFVFDRGMQRRHGIPAARLKPCVTRSNQAQTPFFTLGDYRRLRRDNAKIMLLDAGRLHGPAVRRYIAAGEEEGVHRGYLASRRRPWYALERRPPAPLWLTTFNRRGLRCVRNEAGALALTNFHAFYPLAAGFVDLLHAFALTRAGAALFAGQGREYGGGLVKYEPNDLNNAEVADFGRLGAAATEAVARAYGAYRASCLRGGGEPQALARLDEIFSTFLGD